ncbi:MAG: DUF6364 family protein [Actinomycetota bacterium]
MKNLTLSIPEETYRQARIRAAELGASVSSLVSDYLNSLTNSASEFSRLEDQQRRIQTEIGHFSATTRLSRDQIHGRALH